jgi:RNA polymerase sigma-70 factor (ECF subfamily)
LISEGKYDRSKGSFKRWLLQLTSWRIADQHRKRQREAALLEPLRDSTDATPWVERIADPAQSNDAAWEEEWQRNLTDAALRKLKRKVKARQFQLFDLYVLKRWPIAKVASTLGVSVGQVYLIKHRLTALLKKEIRALESKY